MSGKIVSVFMLTYNQEQYVAQAIEGVLSQRTNFPFELVIGEDNSTDATGEICKKYMQRFPEIIKLLQNNTNLGIGANYLKTLDECQGKYIAICDGDDYWTDPLKLQKQVDILESNPDYAVVFTNNYNLYPDGKKDYRDSNLIPKVSGIKNLIEKNYIASVTVLFRNKELPDSFKSWMTNLPYGDWPTYLWVLKDGGNIYFMNEITAVYRKDWGTSAKLRQTKSRIGEVNCFILKKLRESGFFKRFDNQIEKSIINYQTGLMASYNKEFKFIRAFGFFLNLLVKENPIYIFRTYLYSIKRSLRKV